MWPCIDHTRDSLLLRSPGLVRVAWPVGHPFRAKCRRHCSKLRVAAVTPSDGFGSLIALTVIGLLSYCVVLKYNKTILWVGLCCCSIWSKQHRDMLLR